jgi:hypothetical protein
MLQTAESLQRIEGKAYYHPYPEEEESHRSGRKGQ